MSILDDLKKQAEEVKAQKAEASDTTQRQKEQVLQSVRPRMQALYKYLKDACEQLQIVDPDIHMTYEVPGFGRLGPLRQSDYKVAADDPRNLDKFTLSFSCKRPDQIKFQVDGKESAVRQKEFLWGCNLRFTSKVTADGTGVFFMDAYVPVTFEFEADFENARLNMRMRNVEALGTSRVVFEPRQIDDEFMNELAKLIVRKANRFQELCGNTVSEETRMRLRQQLAQEQYMRQIEVASGGAASPPAGGKPAKPAKAAKPKKKGGLLKALFRG